MIDLTSQKCAIWSTPARTGQYGLETVLIESNRAGGAYRIGRLTQMQRFPLKIELRAKLTTWLIDEHRAGLESPEITPDIITFVQARPALRLSERINRFFLYLSSVRYRPGMTIDLTDEATIQSIAAWTESEDDDELFALIHLLASSSLIGGSSAFRRLSPTGYERLEAVEQHQTVGRQGFVAMWFDQSMQSAYKDGFAPGIVDAGYIDFRIDKKEHTNRIDDEIVAEIRRSRFIVADFTCQIVPLPSGKHTAISRGGVYYEAGLAQGLHLPVIWTVRADCIDYVHFDTRQFAHIVWNDPADLRLSLTNRIRAVIG